MNEKKKEFEKHYDEKDIWKYIEHKEKIDFIINLFMLCPETTLSNIVPSIEVYW
jgi:hypothetical protein